MNKIYKVVWNAARNCYVVGSEFISKTRRGEGYRSNVTTAGARTLLAVCAACGISFYSGGLAVAADNLQTEPTIVIEVQEQKNEAVQPELLYSQLAAASAGADALDITMPADVPAAAEDTSEAPAVDVTSQHSVHDENGYYVYNGTENDTYNSLTKDGLWVGGVDDNTGFHVDNTGHASANGLDVQNKKITNVNDIVMQVETYNTSGNVSGYKALSFKDAGIVPGTVSGDDNTDSVVIGRDSKSSKKHSVVVGDGARTLGMNATAIGTGASAEMDSSVAIGSGSQVGTPSAVNGTAVGAGSKVTAKNGTAVGQGAFAWGTDSTVLGASARVERNADGSVALGKDSYAKASDILDSDTKGVVSVGKSGNNGFTRRIINVADGINASDAATYGQVKDVDAKIDDLDFSNTHYLEEAENVTDALKTLDTEAHDLSGKFDDFSRSGIMAGGTRDSRNAGTNSIQLGNQARAAGQNSIALGVHAKVTGENTEESILTRAKNNGVAIGYSATADGFNTTVLGAAAKAQGDNATALGQGTLVTADNSVALGAGSRVTTDDIRGSDTNGVVSVGKSDGERRIINVADGVNDSDAATVGQISKITGMDSEKGNVVQYDGEDKSVVTFAGENGTKLQNVGDIQIGNAQSTFVGSGLVNGKVYDTDAGQWAENGANATHSMAVGSKSSVRGTDSVAVGPEAAVNNGNAEVLEQSTAVGSKATVSSSFSTALGAHTQAKGDYSVAVGAQSQTTGANATAIGAYAAAGENSVVVGGGKESAAPIVSKANGTAMGTYVDIKSDNGTALGYGSQVGWNGKNSVALGADSVANEENVVSVGHTKGQANGFGVTYGEDLNRRITNVADGKNANDAATVGQISKITGMDSEKGNVVQYDGEDKLVVTFAGENGTKLTNIADGEFKKGSTDAVTAGQLYAAGIVPGSTSSTDENYTNGIAIGLGSQLIGNQSTVLGSYATAGENAVAIGNGSGAAHLNATAVGQNSKAMEDGATALGQHAWAEVKNATAIGFNSDVAFGGDNSVALGANTQVIRQDILETDTNGVVSVGYSGKGFGDDEAFNRRIINVADGINDSDAATFGQVKVVQDSVKALDASAVQYDSVSKSTVTFDGPNGTALKNVSDIVMNTKDSYGKNAQFSFQDAGLLPGDVQSSGNKWNIAIGEGSAVKVEEGTGSKMQMNTVIGNTARITQALVDGEYQDVEKSTALGQGVTVAASNAVGVGQGSNVRGEGGVAVGMQANVSAKSGVAVGKQSKVSSDYSIAIGSAASVGSKSENSVAMGYDAGSLAAGGTAIGQGAKVQGSAANGTAIGKGAIVNVNAGNSVALGASSQVQTADIGSDTEYGVVSVGKSGTNGFTRRIVNVADGLNDSDAATVGQLNAVQSAYTNSGIVGGSMDNDTLATGAVAIGKDSKVHGTGSVAIGTGSKVEQHNSVAIGRNAIVKGKGSVALGASSVATEDNVLSLGRDDGSLGLRIVNMKDGINERDAVTVGQMNKLALGDRNGSLSLDNGATNLAEGINNNTTAIKSLDEQLDNAKVDWGESTQRMKELTEKASAFAAQTQNVDWNALNSVDWNAVNAMAAVPATMNLAVDDVQANEGDTGAEKDDDDRSPQTNGSNPGEVDGNLHVSGNTTLDGTLNVKGDATFEGNATFDKGATMKGDLNMSGNKITGLGAGDVSADSTDAVNGSQLFDVQQQVSDNRNAIGALGSRVSDLGEEVDSVGAISAALAGLHPLDYNGTGSKFQISAALGTYDGTQAAAIGGFYHFNRDTLLSIGGSTSFEGDRKTAANVGVTFRVGEGASEAPAVQDNETKQQMEAMKQEIEMLKAELEQLKNKDTEGTNDKN